MKPLEKRFFDNLGGIGVNQFPQISLICLILKAKFGGKSLSNKIFLIALRGTEVN